MLRAMVDHMIKAMPANSLAVSALRIGVAHNLQQALVRQADEVLAHVALLVAPAIVKACERGEVSWIQVRRLLAALQEHPPAIFCIEDVHQRGEQAAIR